jgi:ParB family transcriptional regulator, chromosome partitioning protein
VGRGHDLSGKKVYVKRRDSSVRSPDKIGVYMVKTDGLQPNPHNPRLLFDRKPLDVLKSSIEKVGILVPLTVYRSGSQGTDVILDGQRRWLCAKELKLPQVPVNRVAEPTTVQNIVTMFQIHKLREDWELMPTALKLELLMKELQERDVKRLAELTGLDVAVVSRCKKLLSYPKRYQDMMLDPDPKKREKADFFIELSAVRNDRSVRKMKWFSEDKFTRRMLDKYRNKASGLKAVTDFRKMKQHISNAVRVGKESVVSRRLEEFTIDDSLTLDHLVVKSADVSAVARRLSKDIAKLINSLQTLRTDEYYGEEELWLDLERLFSLIVKKLQEAGRRVPK